MGNNLPEEVTLSKYEYEQMLSESLNLSEMAQRLIGEKKKLESENTALKSENEAMRQQVDALASDRNALLGIAYLLRRLVSVILTLKHMTKSLCVNVSDEWVSQAYSACDAYSELFVAKSATEAEK